MDKYKAEKINAKCSNDFKFYINEAGEHLLRNIISIDDDSFIETSLSFTKRHDPNQYGTLLTVPVINVQHWFRRSEYMFGLSKSKNHVFIDNPVIRRDMKVLCEMTKDFPENKILEMISDDEKVFKRIYGEIVVSKIKYNPEYRLYDIIIGETVVESHKDKNEAIEHFKLL